METKQSFDIFSTTKLKSNTWKETQFVMFSQNTQKIKCNTWKKLHSYRFSQKQKSNRCVIRGKKTCFIVLTKPQILNLLHEKKQNLYCFSQNHKK
jgi:hypothetical protein